MNLVDLIAAAYVAYGAWRGRARGLPYEGFHLLRMAVAMGAGCGLYGLVSRALDGMLSLSPGASGAAGFVGVTAATWGILYMLKTRVMAFIAARAGERAALGGAVAGGIRRLLIVIGLVGVFSMTEPEAGRAGTSLVGRVASWIIPGE